MEVVIVVVVVVIVAVSVVYSWEVNRDKKFMDISRWTLQGTPLPHQGNDSSLHHPAPWDPWEP